MRKAAPSTALSAALALVVFATGSCASGPSAEPAHAGEALPLPELSARRLGELRAHAPELAERIVRLHRLAREYAARGEHGAAQELATLAEMTLVSAGQMSARLLEAEATAERAEAEVEAARAAEAPAAPPAAAEEPPARARRPARPRRRPTPPPEETPEPVEAVDPSAALSARLAALAGALSELEAESAQERVAVDAVETALIEADRALAEGLVERAGRFADEAERQLAALTGADAPAPRAASEASLTDDARRRLGARAIVRGSVVAVRLDDVLRFDRAWEADAASPLGPLRVLVRGYRHVPLFLVTVGEPSHAAFREERRSLAAYLVERFQIPGERLRWAPDAGAPLGAGTYLVLRAAEGG
ncbi:MAG TPA: hypothetical protein RMH85_21990 [Polyangiaceae bacterium LLY-WYZ-15_(1-7)]|nr:hypothetical protein [Myxococcales bacterium]MAT25984.1 hypothetical protein [Sandaracinus sp.]HJL03227.1 hypothetical protein [Polyangiaceae bacterium LLY-WYZ-15_(1-7)]MBJ74392.1 hypothetical protein [Sandaracinus sp.]HJL11163.1 hypothetical protein [Polyangiaceae bacterium LLY-WYZ-15_(1-7)]